MRLTKLFHNPWLRRLLVALGLLLIVQLRWWWLPWLLAWVPWLKENADALQGADVVIGWVGRAFSLLLPLLLWWRQAENTPRLLDLVDITAEIAACTDKQRVRWVPRTPDHTRFLREHPRFIFRDAPGAGKSREALELLRAADGHAIDQVLVPYWEGDSFPTATLQQIEEAVEALHPRAGRVALWLDDLHRPRPLAGRETAQMLIACLQQRFGSDLIIAGTLRDTFPWEPWKDCLVRFHIEVLQLGPLDADTRRTLAREMAQGYGVALQNEAVQVVTEEEPAPELLRLALERLCRTVKGALGADTLRGTLRQELSGLWQADRRALLDREPAVEHLLQALAWFDASGLTPAVRLVRALALRQVSGRRAADWGMRWALITRRAERALLGHTYFTVTGADYRVDEYALTAPADAEQSAQRLEAFLLGFRRFLRRWPLRRLDPAQNDAKWLAIELGNRLQEVARYDDASRLFDVALRIDPRAHEAANNWGNALNAKASWLASEGRGPEALETWEAAGRQYAEALRIKPDKHEAANNWGSALDDKASWLASEGRGSEALETWEAAGRQYAEALRIKPDLDHAVIGLSNVNTNMAWMQLVGGEREAGLAKLRRADEVRSAIATKRPLIAWHWYRRWFLRHADGDSGGATEALGEALAMGREELKTSGEAIDALNLGDYLLADGQTEEALAVCRRALELKPTTQELWQVRLELRALGQLIGQERVAEALVLLGDDGPTSLPKVKEPSGG